MAKKRLVGRMKRRLRIADAAWESASSRTREGDLLCKGGCFGCCFGLFEIGLPEALVLRDAVDRLPASRAHEVRERARRISRDSAATFPGDASAGILDPSRTEEEDAAYFDATEHAACPLLELPSGRCSVYDSRPATCRTYGLAWKNQETLVHPACSLNVPGATEAHTLATAVDVAPIVAGDQELGTILLEAGLPAGIATTVAHALVGTTFEDLE